VVVHAANQHREKAGMSVAKGRRLDDAFGALADPTRRKVIELLGKSPHRASELAELTSASRPGMSRHLRILKEAGLVREEGDEQDARARLYCLEQQAFEGVKDWLGRVESFWSEQLDSFKTLAEARAAGEPKMRGHKR
jgi:DNA-binding transcriptional ArsR family regulator